MALKRINENPKITDQIVFDILTPDAEGCFSADPYRVDSVRIYFVQRDAANGTPHSYTITNTPEEGVQRLKKAKTLACSNPSIENLSDLARLTDELKLVSKSEVLHYNEAVAVASVGTPDYPAWLSSDVENASIVHVAADADGNAQMGHFELEWNPLGMREGDYYICWTWSPLPASEKLSASQHFSIDGNTQITTSIPTHFTKENKYETLQDRYLPEMFKMSMCPGDLSPHVLRGLNGAVAKGFTVLENMTNQMVDLIDANATHESLLQLLGNTLGVKLRSSDPTLWRRQIKRAIPLAKKKGTLEGLKEALSQAAISLAKFTRLWQVTSSYTYQEGFIYEGDDSFVLAKQALLPTNADNFSVEVRKVDTSTWINHSLDDVSFVNEGPTTTLTWTGDALDIGDVVRVVYETVEVPDENAQDVEDYVRSLPLADQRDETLQKYPLKNWNVRVIAEDDPMIDTVIPTRHPFQDPVIWGKVRTEFPYSENIYNMEEYNGSKRESTQPCDIDRDFVDPCSGGMSSKYTVDLEIEGISDDRIREAIEILKEFTPFHAVLHSINFFGRINDFVKPPVENIEHLMQFGLQDFTVTDSQSVFNRSMQSAAQFKRDALAEMEVAVNSADGLGKNDKIVLFSPDHLLDNVGVSPSTSFLEVLSPSPNEGSYSISELESHKATVTGIVGALDQTAFTFRLSNELIKGDAATAVQDDYYLFKGANFSLWSIKTVWDVNNDDSYSGGAWTITLPAYSAECTIVDFLSDGSLVLEKDGSLPTSNAGSLSYTLKNDEGDTIHSDDDGNLTVRRRGRIDFGDGALIRGNVTSIDNIKGLVNVNDYVLIDGTNYRVIGFVANEPTQIFVDGYTDGDSSGITATAYERLVDNAIGYFRYEGLTLDVETDLQDDLGIVTDPDDAVKDSHHRENFLILIAGNYYSILSMQYSGGVTTLKLAGPRQDWTLAGTNISYGVTRFIKQEATVLPRHYPPRDGYTFDQLDRSGGEVVEIISQNAMLSSSKAAMLNASKGSQAVDVVGQAESISFHIERRDEE